MSPVAKTLGTLVLALIVVLLYTALFVFHPMGLMQAAQVLGLVLTAVMLVVVSFLAYGRGGQA
ncbi:MAG: hypothetical protein IT565_04415 [Rhodospirillales bacterium]|nr:hypothetical protein [Rhodospirillales bacterium]